MTGDDLPEDLTGSATAPRLDDAADALKTPDRLHDGDTPRLPVLKPARGRVNNFLPVNQLAEARRRRRLREEARSQPESSQVAMPLYFPILKWDLAARTAVQTLTNQQKSWLLPIAELGNRPYNADEMAYTGTWDHHFEVIAKATALCWGRQHEIGIDQAIITADELAGATLWSDLFGAFRRHGVRAVPVLSSGASPAERSALQQANQAAGSQRWILRVQLPDFDHDVLGVLEWLRTTLATLDCAPGQVDLLLHHGVVEAALPTARRTLNLEIVHAVARAGAWRSLVFGASGFPASTAGLSAGMHRLPRRDWQLYRQMLAYGQPSAPLRFADHGPLHCEATDVEPRATRDAVRLVMTDAEEWLVVQGRSSKLHGHAQYRDLCAQALTSLEGRQLMAGEGARNLRQIATSHPHMLGVGGPAQWLRDAINRHINVVLSQLAPYATAHARPGQSAD